MIMKFFMGHVSPILFQCYLLLSAPILFKEKNKLNNWKKKKSKFLKWISSDLLEVKSIFSGFMFKILMLFSIVFWVNYLGLMIFIPHMFLSMVSICLFFLAFSSWVYTYVPIFLYHKNKISMPFIGSLMSPSLSLLLSNIEMLTHLFRPITLMARLWVNIWIGHLIISVLSFSLTLFLFKEKSMMAMLLTLFIALISSMFFMFESLIMFLQTFVFSFLIKVFFEENEMNSILLK